jgi:hypothetical protein
MEAAMRIRNVARLVFVAVTASCSSDQAMAPPHPAPPLHLSASIDLSVTGSSPLYQSYARAINDSAVIVGDAQAGVRDREHAITWRPPDYLVTYLPDLGGNSYAFSIGNDGTVGGEVCDPGAEDNAPCHPAYWRGGVLHELGGFGAVNDVCPCDGHTLVGRTLVNGRDHAAIWEDDILIDLGVPDGNESAQLVALSNGYFVGQSYIGVLEGDTVYKTHELSYRWSPTTGWVLIGGHDIEHDDPNVIDVNAQGTALGTADVLWLNGSITPTPLLSNGYPAAINDSGIVAGECAPSIGGAPNGEVPCEYSSAEGWTQIGIESPSAVRGINNKNMAVGELYDGGRSVAQLWTP